MIRIVLLGYGNVGYHLYQAFTNSTRVEVVQVYSRHNISTITTPQTQTISKILEADMYILAVPDHTISELSEALPKNNALVVHTSGGVPMSELSKHNRTGVFYPLQSFNKNTPVDFTHIPICVEAKHHEDEILLKKLGACISEKVIEIPSNKRATLHLAAVFVNNFVNHLYSIASEMVTENDIDFTLLKPLIHETAAKLHTLTPLEAQTGPAKRNDTNTIKKHLSLLKDSSHSEIYELLTNSIFAHQKMQTVIPKKEHGKKL